MTPDVAGGNGRSGRNRHRVRGRQAAKRATFPFINSQIIAVADTGDLALTVSTIEAYVPEMNLVNISTALHRLAKLTANDQQAQLRLRQHPVLTALLAAARQLLDRARAGGASPHCQALSNITWALATIQFADVPLLEAVAELSHGRVADFKPFELSATLWAFAKLDAVDPAACHCAADLFWAAAEYIPNHADVFTFRCLVMTAWAFATAKQHDGRLFRGIAARMLPMVQTANCQELANAAWAFSTAGVRHERLLSELARKALQQLGDFKPQELSNMLWGFAASGFFHEDFFVSAARAAQYLELQAQQMANVLWALSRLRPRHRAVQAALLALLPRCNWMLESLKPQELASVALAAAKCFGRPGGGDHGQESTGSAALPPQVNDFFLAALPRILPRLQSFSGQSLANIVWSLLAVQVGCETDVLPKIACEAVKRAAELEPSALLLLLRNLPAVRNEVCDNSVRALFVEATRRVDVLRPKELQVLSRICTGLLGLRRSGDKGTLPADELRRCCQTLSKADNWTVTSLDDDDYQDDSFLDAGGTSGIGNVGECAGGSSGSTNRMESEAAPPVSQSRRNSGASLASRVPYSVKNTFLHVDEDCKQDSEADEDDPARRLPPSLGIIPDTVSPEKLAAYRADYQRFRAGKAVGAKGELTSSVTPMDDELTPLADDAAGGGDGDGDGDGASQEAGPPGLQLPPPLDFMPLYISLPKLEAYRKDYQRFRAGKTTGAKGEISSRVGQDEAAGAPAARLAPPLDIIPRDVSPRKLEAYRQGYQRFRAGNAVGAKGEVGAAVAHDEPHFIALDGLAACRPGRMEPASTPSTSSQAGARVDPPASAPSPATRGGSSSSAGPVPQRSGQGAAQEEAAAAEAAATGDGREAGTDDGNRADLQVAYSVKNTFLHFEASCEDTEDCSADAQMAKLPPPLKIIPGDVSAEKLEAYRIDYQKFRAGNAVGAKGEVAASVAEGP